ncbi:MAG: hypothetical protein O3B65_07100 [Chloroflexi bacterium]|nr:hypothetical protein [Chloroflexota bacterium]
MSHAEAHAQASRSGDAAGGRYIEPYECGFCGGWHIGHRPGAMREHTELYGEFLKRERWKQI